MTVQDQPFIEAQAILAAQSAPEELGEVLDKFLPSELADLHHAASYLIQEIEVRQPNLRPARIRPWVARRSG